MTILCISMNIKPVKLEAPAQNHGKAPSVNWLDNALVHREVRAEMSRGVWSAIGQHQRPISLMLG